MKKIIVLFALLLGSIISIAQPVTQRGTSAVTVQDSRLFAELNFRPPAFPDTVRANQQIGLDSCGALIFSRDINAYYYRACSPKRWVRVASGGSTSDSAYLSYRPLTDTTFLLCRVGGTRCDTIKINGKGVTQAWLLGGNTNPSSNKLGTISTTDVVIVTNDVARMKIAGNGINRSSAASNRYLMIDTSSRYLYYGDAIDTTSWKLLGNSNAIAGSSFLGTTNNIPLEFRIKNVKSGIIDSTNKNVGLGFNTLKLNTPNEGLVGTYNVAIGHNALSKDTFGVQSVAVGGGAMGTSTTKSVGNVALGYAAMNQTVTPTYDVALGWGALARDYYGSANIAIGADVANFLPPSVGDTMRYNTMVGYASAYQKKAGTNNVFVGDSTGALNQNGSRNVFIGSKAGKNETGSDKLYISNSSISNPLIKGNFADSTLNVNGKMSISLTSQTPDSSLDVTGGVKLRTIYRSAALTDSMLLVGADGGVVKREVIVPSNTNVTRIISGSAVWDSLLVYSVTKCFYYINGILYNSPATNVTLAAADSSNPRIDVIYCDTLGNVGVITGIPSPNPVKPTVNPLSQIELTHININAQATIPVGVSNRIIYNENVGVPNEWNTSKSAPLVAVDFAYPTNPYVGTKSAYAPPFEGNYSLIFTNNAFVNADTLSELSMYLRQNSAPVAKAGTSIFSVILYKSGVKVTNQVLISDGFYGYSLLTLNSYQHLAIPFTSFVFSNPLDKTFDQIQIVLEFSTIPKLGFQFDYITAGAGGTPPAVTSDYWTLSGNDNTSFPNAKLGTTSKDQLSIVTNDIERINITNAGVISIPQLQTTTDTLLYKPLVINPTNGQVAGITNWGNSTVYTENPIMSRTSNDSNIIYFNPDTAAAWRGGDGGDYWNTSGATTLTSTVSIGSDNDINFGGINEDIPNFNITANNISLAAAGGYLKFPNLSLVSDTTNYKPIVQDGSGNIYRSDIWGSGGGGGGGGTVTNVATGYGLSGGPITTTGTLLVDSATLSSKYLRIVDTTGKWVSNISRTIGKDSIIFFIGSTRYAIKDSVGTNPAPVGYYGAFQDNTSQTAASANTAYPVKFNTTDLTNGVSVVNDGSSNPTRITLANTGIYNIQFSLQLEKTGGSGNMIADIWVRKNGVDIPSTTGKVVLTGSANASPVVAAWNYVLDLAAGDYVQLMWATSNTNVEIVAATATSPHPAIPSSILTVTQQSGIMAGTGITAINSLTGAAQTMVTGTDSTDFRIVSTGTTHKFNLPTASATNRGALSSTDWTTFNNKQSSLTFSTGLTNSSGTVTSNLSTGVAGGQSVVGGTAASDSLTISSTTNATKGKIKFGISAYDEVNNRLGIQQTTPLSKLHINANQNSGSSDDANGILLANTSAAISGTQSASPPTVWQGNGWKTNTTPASQDVRFKAYVLPVQGTTNPSGTWTLASSINGATYINRYQASSAGTHTFYDNSGTSLFTLNNTGTITMGNGQISSLASITASTQFKSGSATSTSAYRTFNGGSDITPTAFFGASETNTAGTLAYATDVNNGLSFTAGNGTRQIARAGINIASLTNTAGAETGDLTFSTQNNGAVMTEKMRIFAAGNVAIGTTTNAGYKLDVNGTARVQGALNFNPTNTASGTTGNQTINKASGTVNIAAAGTTVTVTNSLVSATSIVYAVIRTNDATATIKNVVPAAGSFVINLGAAATAEVSIGFFVIN